MPRAVIALGSNIAPEKHLEDALVRLARQVRVLALSHIYETPPVGAPGTPHFLNGAVLIETELDPITLRDRVLRAIEQELGRVRQADPNAPRTIDLDLVLYEGAEGHEAPFPLPAPDLYRYAHVAIPVAQVARDWPLDKAGTTVAHVARQFNAADFRRRPDVERRLHEAIFTETR